MNIWVHQDFVCSERFCLQLIFLLGTAPTIISHSLGLTGLWSFSVDLFGKFLRHWSQVELRDFHDHRARLVLSCWLRLFAWHQTILSLQRDLWHLAWWWHHWLALIRIWILDQKLLGLDIFDSSGPATTTLIIDRVFGLDNCRLTLVKRVISKGGATWKRAA